MKLRYSDEPTILRHESKKLGRIWEVAVYLPIGERGPAKRPKYRRWKNGGIREAVIAYMREHDPNDEGVSLLELSIQLNVLEDSVMQMLKRNPAFFYSILKNKHRHTQGKTWIGYWHLVTPATKEGEHGDTN